MKKKSCSRCGTSVVDSMRICPKCGGKSFGDSPLASKAQSFSTTPVALQAASIPSPVQPSSFALVPAGHLRRLAASVVDTLIFSAAHGLILVMVIWSGGSTYDPESNTTLAAAIGIAVSLIFQIGVISSLHSGLKSATWGKQLLMLRLVTVSGGIPTFSQCLIRALLQSFAPTVLAILLIVAFIPAISVAPEFIKSTLLLSMLLCLLAILVIPLSMILFRRDRKSLFDVVCKTQVISSQKP